MSICKAPCVSQAPGFQERLSVPKILPQKPKDNETLEQMRRESEFSMDVWMEELAAQAPDMRASVKALMNLVLACDNVEFRWFVVDLRSCLDFIMQFTVHAKEYVTNERTVWRTLQRLVGRHTNGEGVDKLKPMVRRIGDQMAETHAKAKELHMACESAVAKIHDFQRRQEALNSKLSKDASEDIYTQQHLQRTSRILMTVLGGATAASVVALHAAGGPFGHEIAGSIGAYCHAHFGMGLQHTVVAGTMPCKLGGFQAARRAAMLSRDKLEYDEHVVSALASLEKPIESWLRTSDETLQEVKTHLIFIANKDKERVESMHEGEEDDFLEELDRAMKKTLLVDSTAVLSELEKLDLAADKLSASTLETRKALVTQDERGRLIFEEVAES